MTDKNGIELRTGQTVKIENAYHKTDNGYYFVRHSPGDADWSGNGYSLLKIGKTGKISTSKYNVRLFPLMSFVNDRFERAKADDHNKQFSTIEVVEIKSTVEIYEYFMRLATDAEKDLPRFEYRYGKDGDVVKRQVQQIEHYRTVADNVRIWALRRA